MDLKSNFIDQEWQLEQFQQMNEVAFHLQKISAIHHLLQLYFVIGSEIKDHLLNLFGLTNYNLVILMMFSIFHSI